MKNRFLFLVGIGALLAMSSCSKDEENLVVKSGEPATLKLTIKGSDLSTKATTTSDLTVPNESFDNKINNIVVGVFRDDVGVLNGYADAIGDVLVSEVTASNPRAFYIPSGSEIKVTAGKRDIIVVANASDADITVLKTATTKSDFLKKVLVLADKEQSKDKLLMTGVKEDADITKGIINPISLEVTRLVGRVQLVSLKSSFKDSYATAVLDVDRIFLHNALFNYPVDPSLTNPYTKLFHTGWDTAPALYGETIDPKLMDATTYSLSANTTATNFVTSSNHYFYTFPNGRSDLSTELDLTTATKLVISGKFYPNGTSGEFTYVYYPIVINKDVDATQARSGYGIERNYVYSISATIFRPGVTDPDKPLDPASISLTITVANWLDIEQDNDL